MGLDMYAYTSKGVEDDKEQIFYWRKFNALHGWMENLYRERGGTDDFNCEPLELSENDILRLKVDADANELVPTDGFFFGVQEIHPDDMESLYKFCEKSLVLLDSGYKVWYDSWW